ncbi:MAG: bifunctional phosphoribosyl-AMP cyclohydrolase/phosphoribosyl-ATP diphosphatase HisIE [Bacteroidales bacterium]
MEKKLDFSKLNGLIPAIIQEPVGGKVLMTGFMNEEALRITKETGKVTFYSRTRQTIWTKGETSGNFLFVKEIFEDCDQDTLLVYAEPSGVVCHTGDPTCFHEDHGPQLDFIRHLQQLIHDRKGQSPESSYTARLFEKGTARIAQKVGEEAVETVIEAMKGDNEKMKEEAADLIYHLLVLLSEKNMDFKDVVEVLKNRHK